MSSAPGDRTVTVAPPTAAAELRERLLERQNPHSLFLMGAAALLLATLFVDLIVKRDALNPLLFLLIAAVCVAVGIGTAVLGSRFPLWVGLVCVACFVLATIYFLGPSSDLPSAVASLQELPILALYLGWFMRPVVGRLLVVVCATVMGMSVSSNPLFAVDGDLGLAPVVHAFAVMLFCFEVGSYLWRRAERRAHTDQLTAVLNRRGFMERLERELVRATRTGTPMSLVVIDFDRFKALNDSRGHAAGDAALADTVAQWKRGIRARDVLGRTGGDEFALLLDRTDAAAAQRTMLRLRAASPHPWSWGLAEYRVGDDPETLFVRADLALYERKRSR